jgi:hypothetical protein
MDDNKKILHELVDKLNEWETCFLIRFIKKKFVVKEDDH